MKRFKLSKLVRDKIPTLNEELDITNEGLRILSKDEYISELLTKAAEEALELSKQTERVDIISELADMYEIIDALKKELEIDEKDIIAIKDTKRAKKGGFDKKIYIESLLMDDSNKWAEYYSREPDIFPQLPIEN